MTEPGATKTRATEADAAHPLDNPVFSSLLGPHARFAERKGRALRYPVDVVPFAALPDDPGPADWADLAALAGPGATLALAAERTGPPDGWQATMIGEGVQLVDAGVAGAEPGEEVVRLGPADVLVHLLGGVHGEVVADHLDHALLEARLVVGGHRLPGDPHGVRVAVLAREVVGADDGRRAAARRRAALVAGERVEDLLARHDLFDREARVEERERVVRGVLARLLRTRAGRA